MAMLVSRIVERPPLSKCVSALALLGLDRGASQHSKGGGVGVSIESANATADQLMTAQDP
jgi:hypothetical protein